MVGIVYLVVQILSRHLSVSFCPIVNESQAELDCQYEFPTISFLTHFNLTWTVGKEVWVGKTHAIGIKQLCMRVLLAFSGELEQSYRVASVLSYLLNIKLLCSQNSLIMWKCRGLHSAVSSSGMLMYLCCHYQNNCISPWCHLRPGEAQGSVVVKAWTGWSTGVSTCIYKAIPTPMHWWSGSF